MSRRILIAVCLIGASFASLVGAQAPDGRPLRWSDGAQPTRAAGALLQEMRHADERGLDPEDYSPERLAQRLADARSSPGAGIEPWVIFDTELSQTAIRFLSDLHFGRIAPASVGQNLTLQRDTLDVAASLDALATAPDVAASLDALEPQFKHYALLKQQLVRYRALAADSAITDLPAFHTKSLKPGDAYAGAAQLRRLLAAVGDLSPADAAPADAAAADVAAAGAATGDGSWQTLTPPVVEALKSFQRRHGEKPDGVLGAATFKELTRPLSSRARQIELTMERWRWLPSALQSAPIIVNIPQFRLFAFDSTADTEAQIRRMDVIVGKAFEATQTPVFTADMTYLIFRPYWEVPRSIAVKEILPGVRRNPAYLDKHQMELVRGEGESPTIVPNTAANIALLAKGLLRVRQKPGPDNSLGLVKFMFPNRYNVYLHSTPARLLFNESRRDFSHGCIRVSDPVGLAQYVLRDSPEWTREKILEAMNGSTTMTVTLKNRIRVFVVYGTALATEDGKALFFDDIYGHDQRLEAALAARRAREPLAPDAPPAAPR